MRFPSNQRVTARTPCETCCAICQDGWRISQKIGWTKERWHQGTHLQAFLVNHLKVVSVKMVFSHTSRRTEIAKYAREPRSQGHLAGGAVPRADIFGDLITADHKVLNEEGESRNNHRYAVRGKRFDHSMDTSLYVKNENFSVDGEEFTKVSRADEETQSNLR